MQNRKLDGTWKLWKVNKQEPSEGYVQLLIFEKGKKNGGSGYFSLTEGSENKKHYFTYQLNSQQITFIYLDKVFDNQTETISRLNARKLELMDGDGNEFLFTAE